MKTAYTRMSVLALAVGLAAITAGCGKSHHDETAGPPAAPLPADAAAGPPSPAAPAAATASAAADGPAPAIGGDMTKPSARSAAKAAPPAASARCSGTDLTAGLRIGALAAGRRAAALTVRNRTSRPCTLGGFPALQLLGRGDDPISTLVVHEGSAPALRLSPGATAWAPLTWGTSPVADEPTGGCEPAASRLAVFAPDDEKQINLDYSAGPVCDHGRVQASAFRAGTPTA